MGDLLNLPNFAAGLAPMYVSADDNLRVRAFNAAAGVELAIEGRLALLDGDSVAFREVLVPSTDRTISARLVKLARGVLLNVSVRASAGTPRRGQCFAIVELVRGFTGDITPLAIVTSGYVTETARPTYPGTPVADPTEGAGCIRSITGTDPAAGAEWSETVPTNARWRVLSVVAQLVTDANPANRQPIMLIDDGAAIVAAVGNIAAQAAGQTVRYVFSGTGADSAFNSGAARHAAPFPLVLMGGYRIRSSTSLLQAGDNWSAPQLLIEEWIED